MRDLRLWVDAANIVVGTAFTMLSIYTILKIPNFNSWVDKLTVIGLIAGVAGVMTALDALKKCILLWNYERKLNH